MPILSENIVDCSVLCQAFLLLLGRAFLHASADRLSRQPGVRSAADPGSSPVIPARWIGLTASGHASPRGKSSGRRAGEEASGQRGLTNAERGADAACRPTSRRQASIRDTDGLRGQAHDLKVYPVGLINAEAMLPSRPFTGAA